MKEEEKEEEEKEEEEEEEEERGYGRITDDCHASSSHIHCFKESGYGRTDGRTDRPTNHRTDGHTLS